MSFFQTILDSIANPDHSGSHQDLQSLLQLHQSVPAGQGGQIEPILNALGSHLQTALQQHEQTNGPGAAQQAVSQLSHPGTGPQELQNVLGPGVFDGLISAVSSRTGLSAGMITSMLPMLIPAVMKLLSTGTPTNNPQGQNPVLGNFLNSGQNGGALLTEAFQLASQFMRR